MTNAVTFKVLEDIARDLSASRSPFRPSSTSPSVRSASGSQPEHRSTGCWRSGRAADERQDHPHGQLGGAEPEQPRDRRREERHRPVGMEAVRGVLRRAMEQLLKSMQPFEDLQRLWSNTARCRRCASQAGLRAGQDQRRRGNVHGLVHDRRLLPDVVPPTSRNWSPTRPSPCPACRLARQHRPCSASALGLPEMVSEAADHETDRDQFGSNLSDVLYAQQDRQPDLAGAT